MRLGFIPLHEDIFDNEPYDVGYNIAVTTEAPHITKAPDSWLWLLGIAALLLVVRSVDKS